MLESKKFRRLSVYMSRPTVLQFDAAALSHNIKRVKFFAPNKKIIAMVKANAYGCDVRRVVPLISADVEAFGVTCTEEAITIRKLNQDCRCILFHGIYHPSELDIVSNLNLECVIHQPTQLKWISTHQSTKPLKIWIKVNTGMNRLGFNVKDIDEVISTISNCPWINKEIGFITHLACADEPLHPANQQQIDLFRTITAKYPTCHTSIANSAAIMGLPQSHADFIRPGIMLYGISPFGHQSAADLGLKPVMKLISKITAIHDYPAQTSVGYGKIWSSDQPCRIGIVPIGYGDGYPRHLQTNTYVWIKGHKVPIVGRVSMDILTVDLTKYPDIQLEDDVELWGPNIPIEEIARASGTIAYELICQMTQRLTRS